MKQFISALSLVVPDYDEAIEYYVETIGFKLVSDVNLGGDKRWVTVAPQGSSETMLVLGKADGPEQEKAIGLQAGGRVFLFLSTDDFARDHAAMLAKGVQFLEEPRHEVYGTVAVFQDKFGNKWDLIEQKN